VLPIHMPSMRDRLEDVPVLTEHFVARLVAREGCLSLTIDGDAMDLMSRYAWPGNVRELQNVCERAVVLLGARQRAGDSAATRISRDMVAPWLTLRAVPTPDRVLAQAAVAARSIGGYSTGLNGSMSGGNGSAHSMYESKPNATGASLGQPLTDESGRLIPLEQIEREAIVGALRRFNGHRQKTAKALGIGVRTLGLKLKKWKELQLVEPTL